MTAYSQQLNQLWKLGATGAHTPGAMETLWMNVSRCHSLSRHRGHKTPTLWHLLFPGAELDQDGCLIPAGLSWFQLQFYEKHKCIVQSLLWSGSKGVSHPLQEFYLLSVNGNVHILRLKFCPDHIQVTQVLLVAVCQCSLSIITWTGPGWVFSL